MEEHLTKQIVEDEAVAGFFLDDDDEVRPEADWWYGATSLGLGENKPVPRRPYMVWNEAEELIHQEVKETSNAKTRRFHIYIYDHKGDFTRINAIIKKLEARIKAMAPFVTEAGVRCSQSNWEGASRNIADDGYDSCCRFVTATFTVSD